MYVELMHPIHLNQIKQYLNIFKQKHNIKSNIYLPVIRFLAKHKCTQAFIFDTASNVAALKVIKSNTQAYTQLGNTKY